MEEAKRVKFHTNTLNTSVKESDTVVTQLIFSIAVLITLYFTFMHFAHCLIKHLNCIKSTHGVSENQIHDLGIGFSNYMNSHKTKRNLSIHMENNHNFLQVIGLFQAYAQTVEHKL